MKIRTKLMLQPLLLPPEYPNCSPRLKEIIERGIKKRCKFLDVEYIEIKTKSELEKAKENFLNDESKNN